MSTSKACTKCGEVKDLVDGFHRSRDNRDGRTGACKACACAAASANARKRRAERPVPTEFPELKRCGKCGEVKQAQGFYVDRLRPDGLSWGCRQCNVKQAQESTARRKVAGPRQAPKAKACTVCGDAKEPADFYSRPGAFDGLASDCKACARAKVAEWREANPEKVAEYQALYNLVYRDERLEWSRRWREANPEHRREYQRRYDVENAERVAAWKRAWYEENRDWLLDWIKNDPDTRQRRSDANRRSREKNRDKHAERQRRRRVDKLGLTVADVDVDALWTGACGICDQPLDRELKWPDPFSKSIDHTIPLSRGGTHEAHNLTWAHLFCNISKGARVPAQTASTGGSGDS